MMGLLTLANLITLTRIVMTPFIVAALNRRQYTAAVWLIFFAAMTDLLDGMAARREGGGSKTGEYLDPVADKILLSCVFIGLALAGATPIWLVAVIFGRDLWILALSAIALRFTGFRELQPAMSGKVSTCMQLLAAFLTLAEKASSGSAGLAPALPVMWGVVTLLAAISGAEYTARGIRYLRTQRDPRLTEQRDRSSLRESAKP